MNYLLLIETVFSSIKAIDQLMPGSPSKDKLAAAIALIEGIVGTVAPMLPALTATIAAICALTKKAATVQPTPAK